MAKIRKGLQSNGKFAKGNKLGERSKRPSLTFMKQLEEALKKVEKEEGITLAEHAIKMAYTDKTVLVAVLKKFAPDLAQVKIEPDGAIKVTFELKDFRKVKNENKEETESGG